MDNFNRNMDYLHDAGTELDGYLNGGHQDNLTDSMNRLANEKRQLLSQMKQVQQQLLSANNTIDKLTREKRNLQNDRQNLSIKLREQDRSHKQVVQKLQQQKSQLLKQIKGFQGIIKQHQHTNRQKQKDIKGLKDGLKKYQQKVPFKNNFDVLQKLQHHGPTIYLTNAQSQYNQLSINSIEETFSKLSKENQHLKECLTNVYHELNSVLKLKKETLRKRNGGDEYEFENLFELINFKPETLNMPEGWNRQALENLNGNLKKFKDAIQYGDSFDQRSQVRKDDCIKGVKDVIKNYKEIVNAQDQVLNRVMLRAKEFKGAQMLQMQNRFTRVMDNHEVERAKNFIEEQDRYLTSKNSELERTRKALQDTMRKAEESKHELIRKRKQYEQDAFTLRKQVEVLPAVLEEELNKRQ